MRKKVLLVEDSPPDRNMYGNILWYNGYDVLYAADGAAALTLVAEEQPDLIVLDLHIPHIHGLELASRIKQDFSTTNIPIIALTAMRERDLGADSRMLGYSAFLEKPASPLDLLRQVESLIGRATADQAELLSKPTVVQHVEQRAITISDSNDNVSELQRIGSHLKANLGAISATWESLARRQPWFVLPAKEPAGNMPKVINAIAVAAMVSIDDAEARRRIVMEAAEHGAKRRALKLPESIIPTEFHLLSRAVWRYLNETWRGADDTFTATVQTDSLVTLALNAAMWGYFRLELEPQISWEEAISKLVHSDMADAEMA